MPIYCCKICKNGKEFRFNSPAPCSDANKSLPCQDPKNPCEYFKDGNGNGNGKKDPECLDRCREEFQNCQGGCAGDPECRRACLIERRNCEDRCPTIEEPPEDGECPHGKGEDWEGCSCGKKYGASGSEKCVDGYVWIRKVNEPEGGQCECSKWCTDIGYAADCQTKVGPTENGEFKWSGELSDLLKRLMERIGELFDYPRGLSDEERQAVINYMTRSIKLGEAPRREATERRLGRMGMLDSELALEKEEELGRETRELTSGAREFVAVDEINRRFQELTGTTGMASQLIQQLLGSEQMIEALSAARRGEGRQDISMFLDYLRTLLGTQTAGQQPYSQALINYMTQLYGPGGGGGGAGMSSWMPYLLYYFLRPQAGGTPGEGWV